MPALLDVVTKYATGKKYLMQKSYSADYAKYEPWLIELKKNRLIFISLAVY